MILFVYHRSERFVISNDRAACACSGCVLPADEVTFYEKLTALLSFSASRDMFRRRQKSYRNRLVGGVNWAGTFWTRAEIGVYRRLLNMLRQDSAFRAFHEGRATSLPEFYHRAYERSLGPFAELISRSDRRPNLDQDDPCRSCRQG